MRNRIELGVAIFRARRTAGLTQNEVASRSRMSRPAIANIERGHQGMPVETLCSVAEAIGVTVGYLLGEHADAGRLSMTALAKLSEQQRDVIDLIGQYAEVTSRLVAKSEAVSDTLASLSTTVRESSRG